MEWNIKEFSSLSVSELYDILSLRSQVFVLEQNCHCLDSDGLDRHSYHVFAYTDAGTLAGVMRIVKEGYRFPELSFGRVAVPKELRGRGIATQMLKAALCFAQNVLGEQRIKLSAQAHLVGFYGALGFKECSEVYMEEGIPHVEMIWQKGV